MLMSHCSRYNATSLLLPVSTGRGPYFVADLTPLVGLDAAVHSFVLTVQDGRVFFYLDSFSNLLKS